MVHSGSKQWLFNTKQQRSCPVIHKVGNADMFVLLKFENKLDTLYQSLKFFNSKHHDKCKFASTLIQLLTIAHLFRLKIVQKHQLCVLRENSNVRVS